MNKFKVGDVVLVGDELVRFEDSGDPTFVYVLHVDGGGNQLWDLDRANNLCKVSLGQSPAVLATFYAAFSVNSKIAELTRDNEF